MGWFWGPQVCMNAATASRVGCTVDRQHPSNPNQNQTSKLKHTQAKFFSWADFCSIIFVFWQKVWLLVRLSGLKIFTFALQKDHLKFLMILLMAEILHHLGCMKPYTYWEKLPINWCRISAINTRNGKSTIFFRTMISRIFAKLKVTQIYLSYTPCQKNVKHHMFLCFLWFCVHRPETYVSGHLWQNSWSDENRRGLHWWDLWTKIEMWCQTPLAKSRGGKLEAILAN